MAGRTVDLGFGKEYATVLQRFMGMMGWKYGNDEIDLFQFLYFEHPDILNSILGCYTSDEKKCPTPDCQWIGSGAGRCYPSRARMRQIEDLFQRGFEYKRPSVVQGFFGGEPYDVVRREPGENKPTITRYAGAAGIPSFERTSIFDPFRLFEFYPEEVKFARQSSAEAKVARILQNAERLRAAGGESVQGPKMSKAALAKNKKLLYDFLRAEAEKQEAKHPSKVL